MLKRGKGQERATVRFSPEQITKMVREKAYELYTKRGNRPGDPLADWLTAERHVRAKLGI